MNPLTSDRIEHYIIGILFLVLFTYLFKINWKKKESLLLILSCLLGTWVSDWDLIFGIGFHRNPITHSFVPLAILWHFVKQKDILIGFAIGLASHLFWDIIYYGNVHWISGGNNDRIFLFVNFVICTIWSIGLIKKQQNVV